MKLEDVKLKMKVVIVDGFNKYLKDNIGEIVAINDYLPYPIDVQLSSGIAHCNPEDIEEA